MTDGTEGAMTAEQATETGLEPATIPARSCRRSGYEPAAVRSVLRAVGDCGSGEINREPSDPPLFLLLRRAAERRYRGIFLR